MESTTLNPKLTGTPKFLCKADRNVRTNPFTSRIALSMRPMLLGSPTGESSKPEGTSLRVFAISFLRSMMAGSVSV